MKSLALFLMLPPRPPSHPPRRSVHIYLVPWDTEFYVAAKSRDGPKTGEHIRKDRNYRGVGTRTRLFAWLETDKMKADPKTPVSDIQLVIDAEQEDGTIQSYYASRFAICEARSGRARPI